MATKPRDPNAPKRTRRAKANPVASAALNALVNEDNQTPKRTRPRKTKPMISEDTGVMVDITEQVMDAMSTTGRFSSGPETDVQTVEKDPHTARAEREGVSRDTAKARNYAEAFGLPESAVSSDGIQSITLTKRLTEKSGLTSYARPGVRSSMYLTKTLFASGEFPTTLAVSAPAGSFAEPGETPEQAKVKAQQALEKAQKLGAKAQKLSQKAQA